MTQKNMPERFDTKALEEFYKTISSKEGMEVKDFQETLNELFKLPRSEEDVKAYRLGKGKWKKLRDEVSPVSRYLHYRGLENGRVRFPLNNIPPDCVYSKEDRTEKLTIEVTIAQGKERHFLKKKLNDEGSSGGILGLSDDADNQAFQRAIDKDRVMYSSEHALKSRKEGILRCIKEKKVQSPMGVLVIEANLNSLAMERWNAIVPELEKAASDMPFDEVHVLADSETPGKGFTVK